MVFYLPSNVVLTRQTYICTTHQFMKAQRKVDEVARSASSKRANPLG